MISVLPQTGEMHDDLLPPHPQPDPDQEMQAGYRPTTQDSSVSGNRTWWDAEAATYYDEHGEFLGDRDLCWGPEGLQESTARLLGDVAGKDVLEIGCGAGQGARWAASAGARVLATDLSGGMLAQARRIDATLPAGTPLPRYVQCDACRLPLAAGSFDIAFSAYGAIPFVADSAGLMGEVARVLRPGGRWVFSLTHPIRWAFPDAPGPAGLTVHRSYFDTTPYVESEHGQVTYAEHHRTLSERIRELTAAGFHLLDLVEPPWPDGHERTWGGWSPLRGRLIPGTAVFVARRTDTAPETH